MAEERHFEVRWLSDRKGSQGEVTAGRFPDYPFRFAQDDVPTAYQFSNQTVYISPRVIGCK